MSELAMLGSKKGTVIQQHFHGGGRVKSSDLFPNAL
jgi:hypothetical protein